MGKEYPEHYFPGLYVSVGHGSRGLLSAALSAELIASMICNEPLPVAKDVVKALDPTRFLIRSIKRRD